MDRGASEAQIADAMEKRTQAQRHVLIQRRGARGHGTRLHAGAALPAPEREKDGTIADGVATAAQLGKLSRYVDRLLKNIAAEMGRGNIDADPNYQSESKNASPTVPLLRPAI